MVRFLVKELRSPLFQVIYQSGLLKAAAGSVIACDAGKTNPGSSGN
jgi:hypothetical protein